MASIRINMENARKYAIVVVFLLILVLGGLTAYIGLQLDRGGLFTAGGGSPVCVCDKGQTYQPASCGTGGCLAGEKEVLRCDQKNVSAENIPCNYVHDSCVIPPLGTCVTQTCNCNLGENTVGNCGGSCNPTAREILRCDKTTPGTGNCNYVRDGDKCQGDVSCSTQQCPESSCNPSTFNPSCGDGQNEGKRSTCVQSVCSLNGSTYYELKYVTDVSCDDGGGNPPTCPTSECNPSTFTPTCEGGQRTSCVQTACPSGSGIYYKINSAADSSCGGGGGSTPSSSSSSQSSQSSTTTSNACGGQDRANGCTCSSDGQCASGFCGNDNTCRRAPECRDASGRPNGCQCSTNSQCATGNCLNGQCRPVSGCDAQTGRPNGCFCGQDSRCASGNCDVNTNTCVGGGGGGGGNLPSTGLFDEDGRPLLIGLLLLLGGLIMYWLNRPRVQTASTLRSGDYLDPEVARLINSGAEKYKRDSK